MSAEETGKGREAPGGDLEWTIDCPPRLAGQLDGILGNWKEIFRNPPEGVIKSNRIRTVLRLQPGRLSPSARGEDSSGSRHSSSRSGDGGWILKQYRHGGWIDRLRYRFVPSRAVREWRGLRRLRDLGFPAPRPLACGVLRVGGSPVGGGLVMEEVPGGIPVLIRFRAIFSGSPGDDLPAEAAGILARTARLIRELHDRGIDQPDSHGTNFLEARDGTIHVIDLHATRFHGRGLPGRRRRANLGKFVHSLGGTVPRPGIRHFLAAYLGVSPDSGTPLEKFERAVERRAAGIERERLRSRSRRCFLPSTKFAVDRRRGTVIYRRREVPPAHPDLLLSRPCPGSLLKSGPGGWVRSAALGGRAYLIKSRTYSPWESLRSALEGHRLRRGYRVGFALEVRRLPTPRVLALREDRLLGLVRRAWLLTELIPGGVSLDTHLWAEYGGRTRTRGPAARRKFLLARRAGELIRGIHDAGLYSQDLSPQNIILCPSRLEEEAMAAGAPGEEHPPFLFLADLDSVHLWRRLGRGRRRRNLIQAGNLPEGHVTWTDRLRALHAYARGDGSLLDRASILALREGLLREAERTLMRMLPRGRNP